MKNVLKIYNQPGEWEVIIPFEKVGQEQEWVGIVDAREPGQYTLQAVAEHKAIQTKGRIIVKVVVANGANVVIKGLIKIAKEAQETDSFLEIRVLLLDPSSRATVDPELEIEANNVKASHAASIGQIDPEQILYLMSRGRKRELAEKEIVVGFLGV